MLPYLTPEQLATIVCILYCLLIIGLAIGRFLGKYQKTWKEFTHQALMLLLFTLVISISIWITGVIRAFVPFSLVDNSTENPAKDVTDVIHDLIALTGLVLAVITIGSAVLGWWLDHHLDKRASALESAFNKSTDELRKELLQVQASKRDAARAVISGAHLALTTLPDLRFTQQVPMSVLRPLKTLWGIFFDKEQPEYLHEIVESDNGATVIYACALYHLMKKDTALGFGSEPWVLGASPKPIPLLDFARVRAQRSGREMLAMEIERRKAFAVRASVEISTEDCRDYAETVRREADTTRPDGVYQLYAALLIYGSIYCRETVVVARSPAEDDMGNPRFPVDDPTSRERYAGAMRRQFLDQGMLPLLSLWRSLMNRVVPETYRSYLGRDREKVETGIREMLSAEVRVRGGYFWYSAWATYYLAKYATELALLFPPPAVGAEDPLCPGDRATVGMMQNDCRFLCAWAEVLLRRELERSIPDAAVDAIYRMCLCYIQGLQLVGEKRLGGGRWTRAGRVDVAEAQTLRDETEWLVHMVVTPDLNDLGVERIYCELKEQFASVTEFRGSVRAIGDYVRDQIEETRQGGNNGLSRRSLGGLLMGIAYLQNVGQR